MNRLLIRQEQLKVFAPILKLILIMVDVYIVKMLRIIINVLPVVTI